MRHNRYVKSQLAAAMAITTAAAISIHAYSNLPFHSLSPPDGSFKSYIAAVQRRKRKYR